MMHEALLAITRLASHAHMSSKKDRQTIPNEYTVIFYLDQYFFDTME